MPRRSPSSPLSEHAQKLQEEHERIMREVAAAEKGVALGGMGGAAPLPQGPQGGGLPKSKWGEA